MSPLPRCCVLACLTISGLLGSCADRPVRPAAATIARRVGTYDSRAVALAYGRSGMFKGWLADLVDEHKQAVAAGDTERAAQLEAKGKARQEQLHAQVFGKAPIEDILELVADRLLEVAAAAGVEQIVPRRNWNDPAAEPVDVTDAIVQLFGPSAKTLRHIAELRGTEPVDHGGDH